MAKHFMAITDHPVSVSVLINLSVLYYNQSSPFNFHLIFLVVTWPNSTACAAKPIEVYPPNYLYQSVKKKMREGQSVAVLSAVCVS